MYRSAIYCLVSAVVLMVGGVAIAQDPAKAERERIAKLSLIEQAPIVVDINRRYYKFYGDPNTVKGDILERSTLTGNWAGGGIRDELVDAGVYLDAAITQFFGGNAHGGTSRRANYTGSLDLWANLDTAKLSNGHWPGGNVFVHGEVAWGRQISSSKSLEQSVGALIPTNYDTTMPQATKTGRFNLSEYYIIQSLSPELSLWVGQMNGAGLIDGNQFANDEKHQFMNTVLVDNPVVGPFAPYTAFTAAAVWLPTTEHVFIAGVMDQGGKVNETVAQTYDTDETVFVGSYGFLPEFGGMPGRYQIVGAYSNKNVPSYAIADRIQLGAELVGIVPIKKKTDNYVTLITADQYLYVKDKKRQVGFGPFFRFGWSPKNRNAIDQFYSAGLGGRGLLIPGRDLDFWGIGWGGTHLSSDLRKDLALAGFKKPRSFEHAIEAFYNIELTGWMHLTFDMQWIINPIGARIVNTTSSVKDEDFAFVLGSRLQIDF